MTWQHDTGHLQTMEGMSRRPASGGWAAKNKEYMVHWFHGLFCDPADETPYIGREGGYQYIWGGPYSANEELYAEFGAIATEDAIAEAINEVERDSIYEWAPSHNHPYQISVRGFDWID
jgi:hypothetical protein